jgi:anti-sigma factor RsiW
LPGTSRQAVRYLDGELAVGERAALEAHLEGCPACRAELEALRTTVQAVASLPERRAPEGFAGRVVEQLRPAGAAPSARIVAVLWTRLLPVAAMLALVLALTVTVSRNGAFRPGARPERLAMDRRSVAPPPDVPAAVDALAGEALAEPERAFSVRHVAERGAGRAAAGEPVGPPDSEAERVTVMATAEEQAPPAVLGLGAAGRPMREEARRRAAPEAEGEAPAALTWRADEMSDEVLDLAAALTGRSAGARAAAGVDGSGAPVFGQIAAAPLEDELMARRDRTVPPEGVVQQVVALTADDPAELARQAVTIANANGVAATLSLGKDEAGGVVLLYLTVPPVQYDPVLRGLAALRPPESNVLSNTAAAGQEFFRAAADNYAVYQRAAVPSDVREAKERARLAEGAARERLALLAQPRHGPAAEVEAAEAAEPDSTQPPGPVNMLIRIKRPAAP